MRLIVVLLFSLFILPSSQVVASEVNINSADAAVLEASLVGVGPEKAEAIVQYREAHGPFASIEDLVNVKGIAERTIEKNRGNLTIDD